MAKKDEIEVEGKVLEALPNAMFKVEIDEQHQVLAVLSGRIRMNFVRIVPGDKVRVVLSPYDLSRGRITWRRSFPLFHPSISSPASFLTDSRQAGR